MKQAEILTEEEQNEAKGEEEKVPQNKEMDIELQQEECEEEKDDIHDDVMETIRDAFENQEFRNVVVNLNIEKYIKNKHGIVTGDGAQFEAVELLNYQEDENSGYRRKRKEYGNSIFENQEESSKWMKENFMRQEFFVLISLAVFHDMPFIWIVNNAEWLKHRSLEWRNITAESEEIIPKSELLSALDAIAYEGSIISNGGKTEAEFAGFLDEAVAESVLKCVWEQFVDYRVVLLKWLKYYVYKANWSQANAAIEALSMVAQIDYYYFETRVVSNLMERDNIAVVPEVMYLIAQNGNYTDKVNGMVKHWGALKPAWYVATALLTARKLEWEVTELEKIMQKYFDSLQEELILGEKWTYAKYLPLVFVYGQRGANFYKAMVKAIHSRSVTLEMNRKHKEILRQIVFMLIEIDYEVTTCKKNDEMIFVNMTLIKNSYRDMVVELWQGVWRDIKWHGRLKELMKAYWCAKVEAHESYKEVMCSFLGRIGVSAKEQQEFSRSVNR